MTKAARLLCLLWACGPLAVGAGAAESPAHDGAVAESTRVDSGKATRATGRNAAPASPPRRSVTPRSGGALVARSNADRLHSLQRNSQAQKGLARQSNGRMGSNGPVRPTREAQPKLIAANRAARPAARVTPAPRNSAIGGLHAQGSGRLGGPAIVRAARGGTLDGTQLRRKF